MLEFRTANYKSFKDELVFSLIPAPKQKGLDYSVLRENAGKVTYKGLCSAVIYGPNASGKTNIIGAMDTFKSIVLRGHIRNADNKMNPNAAACSLELIPNNAAEFACPVSFAIKFITNGLLVEYAVSLELGRFLAVDHPRKVVWESLRINESLVFSRDQSLQFGDFGCMQDYLPSTFAQNVESAKILAASNLAEDELFLMNGFITMFSVKLVKLITDWLSDKFMVIYQADALHP